MSKYYACIKCGRVYNGNLDMPIVIDDSGEGEGCCGKGSLIKVSDEDSEEVS